MAIDKKKEPLVSIGIPVYKSTYLSRAIDSAINQTYRNLEIIIVNDCSPYDIDGVVSGYDDRRIKYYVNEKNLGASDPGYNWNECLKKSTGEFFCLLCDDDVYEPEFVEELLRLSAEYPECNVFHSSVKVVNTEEEIIQRFPKSPKWESCSDYIINCSRRLRKQTVSEWMFRTNHVRSLGGYDNLPLAWGSDYLSVMRFSLKGGIASSDKELAVFRRSGENITMQRQGHCETKVYALSLYKQRLTEFISQNDDLRASVPMSCVNRIKDCEDRAILMGANWKEYKTIAGKRKEYAITGTSVFITFAKRLIKKMSGR